MSNIAAKAELISSIFTLVHTEADMPRTKTALSEALRIGAEEMTSQITNGMVTPTVGTARTSRHRERDTNLREVAFELAPAKGKRRSPAQAKKMKQVVLRELKNGTPADRLASLFNTTVGNINQMRYR